MGRRGPKPRPAALRVLHNLPVSSRTPLPAASAPPTMPAGLSPEEAQAWHGLITELESVPGLVARADRGVIELLARLEPMLRAAAIVVRLEGSTLRCVDKDGQLKFVQTRPEATFLLKAGALVKGLYSELGLTPSGRCRVALSPAPASSKLDRFLQERHGA